MLSGLQPEPHHNDGDYLTTPVPLGPGMPKTVSRLPAGYELAQLRAQNLRMTEALRSSPSAP